jgi:RNA recognition motif-containing protein
MLPSLTCFQGKPRGYAFIEYEEERSVKEAFDRADGRKIDGRRVLVDVERGRTVKGWKPRSVFFLVFSLIFHPTTRSFRC